MAKSKKNEAPNLGALIDGMYAARAARLEYQKESEAQIAEMKEEENTFREKIIQMLEKQGLAQGRGDAASASITKKIFPQVTDWDRVYAHVKKTGEFDLFEKRISRAAFGERYEAGVGIPGIDAREDKDLSLTKVGK